MLNPSMTQSDLSQALSSSQIVTNYAQATITAVPSLPDPPDWFAPIQTDINTAQGHCQSWIDTICPAVTSSIPATIVQFNGTFQDISAQLLSELQDIQNEPGSIPTQAQRAAASKHLQDLIAGLSTQHTAVLGLKNQVDAYATDALTDQSTLAKDLGTVVGKISNGPAAAAQVAAAIGESFLDSQALGPCNVIVNINMNVNISVSQTGADPSLITTIFAQIILESMLNSIHSAQNDVQNLVDGWAILQNKFAGVLSDLQDATDDQYAGAFEQMDIEAAQAQWQQLADFARTLAN